MENFASEIAKGNLDVPLPIHKNNMFGNFTESFDIMREELKASKERELEAEKAKREMVAELSHDLKTPVATIRATCEVLDLIYRKDIEKLENELKAKADNFNDTDKEEAEQRLSGLKSNLEKIGYIYNKSDMINELVGSVFRATLDDMQEIKIEPKENESVTIESYFEGLKEYGNIIMDNHIPECLVYMDKLRMEQVIDNIVGNSYKYAGTDIHVSFDETEMVIACLLHDRKDVVRLRLGLDAVDIDVAPVRMFVQDDEQTFFGDGQDFLQRGDDIRREGGLHAAAAFAQMELAELFERPVLHVGGFGQAVLSF